MKKLEIELNLNKRDNFYNNYNGNRINQNLIEYISEECYGENLNNGVIININSNFDIGKQEINNMKNIIKKNYKARI